MNTNPLKKMLSGLDPLNGLYDLLKNAKDKKAVENTPPTPESDFNPIPNSSRLSLASGISNTPTVETVEDSLPPSPRVGLPINFAEVAPGVYRSSFPQRINFEHLAELKLKTVLTLVSEEYTNEYKSFINSQGIRHVQITIPPNKGLSATIPLESMTEALSLVSDTRNHPILVHCNKGKHRTGCVVGCYRKMCDWSMDKVITEYRYHAGAKARPLDEQYITEFDQEAMMEWLNGAAYCKAKEEIVLLTPPASEKFVDGEA